MDNKLIAALLRELAECFEETPTAEIPALKVPTVDELKKVLTELVPTHGREKLLDLVGSKPLKELEDKERLALKLRLNAEEELYRKRK